MGFESFQSELRGGRCGSIDAIESIRSWPFARVDRGLTSDSNCFVIDDGRHVFELECVPWKVSVRFALCHSQSVDEAFIDLIRDLQMTLEATEIVCDGNPTQSFEEFKTIVGKLIAARRAEWIAHFGTATAAVTTPDAFERFIRPMAVPSLNDRIAKGMQEIAEGRGTPWRMVQNDV